MMRLSYRWRRREINQRGPGIEAEYVGVLLFVKDVIGFL